MNPEFKEPRPGYVFKNGKFYWFDRRHVLVMAGWPEPRAWLKRRSHGWRGDRKVADGVLSGESFPVGQKGDLRMFALARTLPSGQLLLPGILMPETAGDAERTRRARMAVSQYFGLIPDDVRAELLKYTSRRWHLLNVFARCPGAMDLSRGNPGLLFALASNWVFRKPAVKQSMRAIRSLVNKKQRKILGWLGFPETETARRILMKFDPGSLSVEALLYVRSHLGDPFVEKTFAHMESINRDVIRLVTDEKYRSFISPRLLHDIAAGDRARLSAFSILRDTIRMAERADWKRCPRRFSSLKRLQDVHDELASGLMPRNPRAGLEVPARFQEPPFVGTASIRPITTRDELYVEGHIMKHCVGIHDEYVAYGVEYVYRVTAPVRATLSILRSRSGQWFPGELSLARNEQVETHVRRMIEEELFSSPRGRSADSGEDAGRESVEDGRQLPLMSREQMEVFKRCVEAFGRPDDKDVA